MKVFFVFFVLSPVLSSCSSVRIPNVADYRVERQVAEEAAPIIAVTAERERAGDYRFLLADFPRKDILGMSVGRRKIYISYRLAQSAQKSSYHRWLLRQILAHEIAHEIRGHASDNGASAFERSRTVRGVTAADIGLPSGVEFRNYAMEKELEADLTGMEYWSRLNWDCRIWVDILRGFEKDNYEGDAYHPTDKRLAQALRACPPAEKKRSAATRPAPATQSSAINK